jgi:hypothetical protein
MAAAVEEEAVEEAVATGLEKVMATGLVKASATGSALVKGLEKALAVEEVAVVVAVVVGTGH